MLSAPMPVDPEALRKVHRLLGVSLVWRRLRDPTVPHLREWVPADLEDHTNYILGEDSYGFRAKDESGNDLRGPPWVLLLEYDFRIRKKAFELLMAGEETGLKAALKVGRKDSERRERDFTTPMVGGCEG